MWGKWPVWVILFVILLNIRAAFVGFVPQLVYGKAPIVTILRKNLQASLFTLVTSCKVNAKTRLWRPMNGAVFIVTSKFVVSTKKTPAFIAIDVFYCKCLSISKPNSNNLNWVHIKCMYQAFITVNLSRGFAVDVHRVLMHDCGKDELYCIPSRRLWQRQSLEDWRL